MLKQTMPAANKPSPCEQTPPLAGHLVNKRDQLQGTPGQAYDYILAANGLFIRAQNTKLTATAKLAPVTVRGLAPMSETIQLAHGPVPVELAHTALTYFRHTPNIEAYLAITWDGHRYDIVTPPQKGTSSSLSYIPAANTVVEFHSHGINNAFFSSTDDADEQGFHIYGVIAHPSNPAPQAALRLGIYGYHFPLQWEKVFTPPAPPWRFTTPRS